MGRRNIAWVTAAAILVILSLSIPTRISTPVRRVFMRALSPLVSFENALYNRIGSVRESWRGRRRLKQENIVLQWRVKEMSRELALLRDLDSENRRLRRLLDFKKNSPRTVLPARVTGRDARQWYGVIVIDRGSKHGVKPDMPVVTDEGVVGKVIESAAGASTVLLIVDRRSRIGGLVERTREAGIVEGTSFNACRLTYLPRRAEVRPGDKIISSGLGGVYPKGLDIGTCGGVYEGQYGLYSSADITPAVNFSTLEEVFVLTGETEQEEDFLR